MSQLPYRGKPFPTKHSRAEFLGDVPNRRQKLCRVCAGMPWARAANRLTDAFDPVAMNGRCTGCGEAYAPEPPPASLPIIGSSAGIAVRESSIYGQQSIQRPDNARRASRAKMG